MPRVALLTGMTGGIIGSIAGSFGIVWGIVNILFVLELFSFLIDITRYSVIFGIFAAYFLAALFSPPYFLFSAFSIVLALLLVVSCTLLGVGYYGLYKASGAAMGIMGLITSIVGSITGAIFIILGNFQQIIRYTPMFLFPPATGGPLINYPVFIPQFYLIWIGLIILATTFIILGNTSIATRDITARPLSCVAAGILSIIGSNLFFPYFLVVSESLNLSALGAVLALAGFGLIFSAFVVWSVVFYSSREIGILRKEELLTAIKRSATPVCLYCGSKMPKYSKACPKCGKIRTRCSVCNLYINSGDPIVKCPYCNVPGHRDHLLEWIKVKVYCPNCKKKLNKTEII